MPNIMPYISPVLPLPSPYLRPPANDVHDGLLELVAAGQVIPLALNGRLCFCARCQMKPEYEALAVDPAAAEARLRREEEQAMAAWN